MKEPVLDNLTFPTIAPKGGQIHKNVATRSQELCRIPIPGFSPTDGRHDAEGYAARTSWPASEGCEEAVIRSRLRRSAHGFAAVVPSERFRADGCSLGYTLKSKARGLTGR